MYTEKSALIWRAGSTLRGSKCGILRCSPVGIISVLQRPPHTPVTGQASGLTSKKVGPGQPRPPSASYYSFELQSFRADNSHDIYSFGIVCLKKDPLKVVCFYLKGIQVTLESG